MRSLLDVMDVNTWQALGVVIALLVAAGGLYEWWRRRRMEAAALAVTAVRHDLRSDGHGRAWPSVSLTLVNKGLRTATTNEIVCDVAKRWNLVMQDPQMRLLAPTAYNLTVNRDGPFPQTLRLAVSHELRHDEADQVRLDFTALPAEVFEEIYHVRIHVRYNETKQTEPVALLLVMPEAQGSEPPYFYQDFLRMRDRRTPERLLKSGEKSALFELFEALEKTAPRVDAHNRRMLLEASEFDRAARRVPRVEALMQRAQHAAAPPQPDDTAATTPRLE